MQNRIADPRQQALTEKFEKAYNTSKQVDGIPTPASKQYFEPIAYQQAMAVLKRIQQNTELPFMDLDYFRFHAFKKAKQARNWDIPEGSYAFNLIDLRDVFTADLDWNQPFDCYFFHTPNGSPYRAWLHKNADGIVRYYAQNPIHEEEKWMVDVVDLYGIAFGKYSVVDYDNKRYLRYRSYAQVRADQSLLTNKTVVEEKERLRVIQRQVTNRHTQLMEHHTDDTLLAVLNILIAEASNRTFVEGFFDEQGRAVFLMSTNELVRRVKEQYKGQDTVKKTKVTLNNVLNVLVGLGFVKKLTDDDLLDVDDELLWARNRHARGGKNPISYYVIRNTPSIYWVKKQAKKMIKKRVTLHNVTERRFRRAFGKELANEIFVGTHVARKDHQHKEEKKQYTHAFYFRLKKNGFVTKEELEGIITSDTVANRLWTDLVNETRGFYVKRTTKFLREQFHIETAGALFVSAHEVHPFCPTAEVRHTMEEERQEQLEAEYTEMVHQALGWFGSSLQDELAFIKEEFKERQCHDAYLSIGG